MPDNKVLAASIAAALVVGGLTTSAIRGGGTGRDVPVTLENVPSGIVKAERPIVDVPLVGPLTTDLATDLVQPGERVVTSVNLPDGWAPIGEFTLTKEAVGRFSIIASQMVGHELKVMADNTSDRPARFTATFQYDRVP